MVAWSRVLGRMLWGLILLGLLFGPVVSCERPVPRSTSTPAPDPETARPLVVTTTPVLRELVREIAGDRVEVLCLARSAATVRNEVPARDALHRAQQADLILAIGHGYERWLAAVSLPGRRVLRVGEVALSDPVAVVSATHQHGMEGGHTHEELAAASWLAPQGAAALIDAVGSALERVLPAAEIKVQRTELRDGVLVLAELNGLNLVRETTFAATRADAVYLVQGFGATQIVLGPDVAPPPGAVVLVLPGDPAPPDRRLVHLVIEPVPGQSLKGMLRENLERLRRAIELRE